MRRVEVDNGASGLTIVQDNWQPLSFIASRHLHVMDGHEVLLINVIELASQWLATLVLPSEWNTMVTMDHQPHVVSGSTITDVLGLTHQVVVVKATTKGAVDKNLIVHTLL